MSNKIRALRIERGWSLQTLADKVGRERSTVHKWERGERTPGPDDVRRLADAFQVHAFDITDAPDAPLRPDERALVDAYRGLAEDQQEFVRDMVTAAAKRKVRSAAE